MLRAAFAKNVLGPQLASEVIHVRCDVDADDEPLDGRHAYRLQFPAGQTPPVSGLWSLAIMRFYGPAARILDGSYRLPRVIKTT